MSLPPTHRDEDGLGSDEPRLDLRALPEVERGSSLGAELWLAWAALRSGAGEAFIGVVTALSVLGVVVGVALLNAVLAVMTGFEVDLRDKILGANAHVVVMHHQQQMVASDEVIAKAESVRGVRHAAPFVYSEMMLRSRWGTSGVILKGIDPARTGEVTDVRDQVNLGLRGETATDAERRDVFAALSAPVPFENDEGEEPLHGILLGNELAAQLQVRPGDLVQVINPLGRGERTLLGMPSPTFLNLRVVGTFDSGMFEYDTKWSYVGLDVAQRFLDMGDRVTGLELRVDRIDDVDRISREVEQALGYPHYARHWRNMNQALFEALELEKIVMGLILGMVVVVAGLLIVSNLFMLVLTKRREIAILKAMGAGWAHILRVFVFVGAFIGVVGTSLGTALGLLLCEIIARYEYDLGTDVYYVKTLPVVVEPGPVLVVAIGSLVVCFLATIAPALRAARLHPVDGLRAE